MSWKQTNQIKPLPEPPKIIHLREKISKQTNNIKKNNKKKEEKKFKTNNEGKVLQGTMKIPFKCVKKEKKKPKQQTLQLF